MTVLLGCRSAQQTDVPCVHHPAECESTADGRPVGQVRPASFTDSQPATPERPGPEIHAGMALADFEVLAVQCNPAVAAAAARVEAARGKWVQAGLYPNTVVGYSAGEVGILDTAGKQGIMVSQRLITGGKQRLDRAITARQVDRAAAALDAAHRRVLNDVRIRFYDVLVAQREVELTIELVRVGEELAKASSGLRQGDQISEPDLLQAEIEAEQARILHDNAVNNHVRAWRGLCAVVGTAVSEVTFVEGDVEQHAPEYTWEACLEGILREHPELDAARAEVERARLAICRAYRQRIPDVDLTVAFRHDNLTDGDVYNVQAGLPIPWLDRNQGNIYRTKSELSAASAELRKLELSLEDRLATALRRYDDARQQVRRYSDGILPRADKSLRLVQRAYGEGQLDYLTLLTTQRTYFQANLAYLSALRELRQSVVLLEGKLLSGSLSARAP
ncbi:MAG: TolC family protein [Candidatus Nealsonbacteria bacterium]|nr:TolC family protein [Candidatus Nealsonbacteria bacterium]